MRKKEGRNVLIILGRKINETINERGDHKLERMSGEICFERGKSKKIGVGGNTFS